MFCRCIGVASHSTYRQLRVPRRTSFYKFLRVRSWDFYKVLRVRSRSRYGVTESPLPALDTRVLRPTSVYRLNNCRDQGLAQDLGPQTAMPVLSLFVSHLLALCFGAAIPWTVSKIRTLTKPALVLLLVSLLSPCEATGSHLMGL